MPSDGILSMPIYILSLMRFKQTELMRRLYRFAYASFLQELYDILKGANGNPAPFKKKKKNEMCLYRNVSFCIEMWLYRYREIIQSKLD